jgi:hypothetical protein
VEQHVSGGAPQTIRVRHLGIPEPTIASSSPTQGKIPCSKSLLGSKVNSLKKLYFGRSQGYAHSASPVCPIQICMPSQARVIVAVLALGVLGKTSDGPFCTKTTLP